MKFYSKKVLTTIQGKELRCFAAELTVSVPECLCVSMVRFSPVWDTAPDTQSDAKFGALRLSLSQQAEEPRLVGRP